MLLHSQRVEWLKLWTSFVNFHSASPRNTATQSANFAPFLSNQVISNVSLSFSSLFSFFSRFYPIVHAVFVPKIWSHRQRSFSFSFKMLNLHPLLDIRHVDLLRTSRVFMTIFGQCINVLNYKVYYSMEEVNKYFVIKLTFRPLGNVTILKTITTWNRCRFDLTPQFRTFFSVRLSCVIFAAEQNPNFLAYLKSHWPVSVVFLIDHLQLK